MIRKNLIINLLIAISIIEKIQAITFYNFCPALKIACDANYDYRQLDGLCNNLKSPQLGSAHTPYQRLLPPAYDDNFNLPRSHSVLSNSFILPNPRSLSINVHFPNEVNGQLSMIGVSFGQVISHDITMAASSTDNNGVPLDCSKDGSTNTNCMTIRIPPEDILNINDRVMPFTVARSKANFTDHNCKPSVRNQINDVTHWLDLSVIYGSSNEGADFLRKHINGMLNTSQGLEKDYLPKAPKSTCPFETFGPCFVSGDNRVNDNMLLASLQTIWVREHNRIALLLSNIYTNWTDEKLYQEAKRIVTAEYQHIVYNEYLPWIVGQEYMQKFNLSPNPSFRTYNESLIPQIINEFATSAMRFGHGLVQSQINVKDKNLLSQTTASLQSLLLNSQQAYTNGGLDSLCRGMMLQKSNLEDAHVTDILNNHLFEIHTKIVSSSNNQGSSFNNQGSSSNNQSPYGKRKKSNI